MTRYLLETETLKLMICSRCAPQINSLVVIIYLFNDNLATGGSLIGAILSCHVEL